MEEVEEDHRRKPVAVVPEAAAEVGSMPPILPMLATLAAVAVAAAAEGAVLSETRDHWVRGALVAVEGAEEEEAVAAEITR